MKAMYSISTETVDHERYLLARISEDDASAFTELFNAYVIRLAPYIEKLLNSGFWAEEIIQDVFLKIWSTRHRLKDVENPSAYIYRMAANRAYDLMKKQASEIKLQYQIARRGAYQGKNYTEELTDLHFSEQLFSEAIHRLPPQQLLIYRLRHEDGLSYEEIRARLQISKNTVRNQLVSALDNIRRFLLQHEGMTLLSILLVDFTFRSVAL